MYNIPGSVTPPTSVPSGTSAAAAGEGAEGVRTARTVAEVMAQSQAGDVLDELDRELVGLAPVKARIRDIAALLVIDKLRGNLARNPRHRESLIALATIERDRANYAEAERQAQAALALNPNDREAAALLAQLRALRQRLPGVR